MAESQFGRVQLRIMQVLWDVGRANAREITDRLHEDEAIAHSTVQTLLRQLEAKGAVGHDAVDRTFVFYPLVKEERVKRGAARDLVEQVFRGSTGGLVAYLLKHERISREELDEIRSLIEEKNPRRNAPRGS